ncbi:MAG: TonB family protein [Nevskia sp.]|nr:TonB family protein [Nevskia sp.]
MTSHAIRWESWALSEEADRRFRRILAGVCLPALVLVTVLSIWRIEMPPRPLPTFNPNRYVELLAQEIPKPPPELPKPEEKPKPQEKPTERVPPPKPVEKPIERPPPPKPVESARDLARKTEEFQAIEKLAHLQPQDAAALNTGPLVSPTINSAGGIAPSGENIAGSAARTSGGIGYAGNVSQGQGEVGLGARRTGTVKSTIDANHGRDSGDLAKIARSRAEIQEVFDRNKGALNGIYTRAARENPNIAEGKIVVRLTIAPGGEVTECSLVFSSFGDPEFEGKIIERIKLMRFAAKNVPSFTEPSYSLTFQPS